jgi:GT2 family glycosyltransferase
LAAFLDSDDTWAPGKLAKQVDLYNRVGRPFICHTHETWIRNGRELDQRTYHTKQGGRFFERALERCLISPSSVVISRDVFEQVGVFDTELTAGEDYDLWLRITAHYEVHYIPDKLVTKYGGHGDQLSVTTPAIDRYRIKSIEKILGDYNLNPQYRMAAIAELERKCSIMATGCKKRGKIKEAEYYLGIPIKYKA